MFDTLLVANRGEIAVRIIRTARELGLKTVAVFSDADRATPHVGLADVAVRLGPAPPRESYLRADAIIEAALASGATAIHPGYGFLSENAGFAAGVEDAGLIFVGPTPRQLADFGSKHTARELAAAAGVAMLPGTGLLASADDAVAAAETLGMPVMLKASGGGGGIGMRICRDADEVRAGFESVQRTAMASFGSGGVFLERYVSAARHVEVQVFGDGAGRVRVLGDRDCTLQRRHQKVIEEAPAPRLLPALREWLADTAHSLCASVRYRSAGTVEYVYDVERGQAYFLEVNTRLQVEHPVTEQSLGVDLVAWMLRLAQGDSPLDDELAEPQHSIEARVYAEDAGRDHQPSAGRLSEVHFARGAGDAIRVDTWVETGTDVGTAYDPMLAKIIATGPDRAAALGSLAGALAETRIEGIQTNLALLRAAVADASFASARHTTATLATIAPDDARIDVLRPGTMTTVQDWPGRVGLWAVGVPPSGPMDDRSFRLGNLALGNAEGAPGLECTVDGPALRFAEATRVCVTGAPAPVTVNGDPVPQWQPVDVPAGGVLDIGAAPGPGLRSYLLVQGGLDVPAYLGSRATFTLGGFGGHGGRALRTGDVLRVVADAGAGLACAVEAPIFGTQWDLGVVEGPHAAPEFFTREDIEEFYAASWSVHFNSARTGVRLVGPKPRWARPDGGEAGLHPSNIHDTPYAIGSVDFTGDLPVILGPDGPSLGGFVCPATVVSGERWKLGQLRPGDSVRFVPVSAETAHSARNALSRTPALVANRSSDDGVLARREATDASPSVTYRRSGDDNLLVEYGPMTLDLALRMRVHALASRLDEERLGGIVDVTPGIRSLQIHVDPDVLSVAAVRELAAEIEQDLPAVDQLTVPSRTIHLPLSWDDPATREAIARYMAGVRDDAPWCPWNIEFIRRVNGLDDVADVHRIVYDASYLVLGLGDVYLGAPVATPLDPRHRLVTTKYNPARTWTPENAVGIGGAYLCIYGMEGPGGYQFVGRTVQVWSPFQQRGPFEPGSPWLLRFFDQIRWYPVGAEELLDLRADLAAGRLDLSIEPGVFSIAEHRRFLDENAAEIAQFQMRQGAAFDRERAAWTAAGEFDPRPDDVGALAPPTAHTVPDGALAVEAPFVGNVWRVEVATGDRVRAGAALVSMEAMKLETVVTAPVDATVLDVLVAPGTQVAPGTALVFLAAEGAA